MMSSIAPMDVPPVISFETINGRLLISFEGDSETIGLLIDRINMGVGTLLTQNQAFEIGSALCAISKKPAPSA
jgi:hypothetical protein